MQTNWRETAIREAVEALTTKPVQTTTLERIRLLREADAQTRDIPAQPLRFGAALEYLLSRVSLPIRADDLLLGRVHEEVPDARGEAFYQETLQAFGGQSVPPWFYDQGHVALYWQDLLTLGLPGLRQRAEARLIDEQEPARRDYLRGAIQAYNALETYCRRYAAAAREAGLPEAADACAEIAQQAPTSFRAGLQLVWLVAMVFCAYLCPNPTLTYGRLDKLLDPLYRRDLEEGRLTRAETGDLILDFYRKNNCIMGRGEHQLGEGDAQRNTGWQRNLCYDAPQYLMLAGRGAISNLTLLFVEQIEPRFKNPVAVLRYYPGLAGEHPALWRTIVAKQRASASMMVYNESDVVAAYLRAGVAPEDAEAFAMYGCNWPCLPGLEMEPQWHFPHWARGLNAEERRVLDEGEETLHLPQMFLETLQALAQERAIPASIDDFYAAFAARYEAFVRRALARALQIFAWQKREAPGPLLYQDLFFRDTISSATASVCGGAKYARLGNEYRGFATLIDCFAATDALLYRDRACTLPALAAALADNFARDARLRKLCQRAPKFGADDPLSNAHAHRLLTLLTDIDARVFASFSPSAPPIPYLRESLSSDTAHIAMGARLGATPDGRLAGEPVSQNAQPSPGACKNGLTARLSALAALPGDRVHSGGQNITIQPRLFAGEEGLSRLAALLSAYLDAGGLQAQISATDEAELRDAQAHPERHGDLMVRITGYSAIFVDMNKRSQDDVIRRDCSAV